MNTRTLVAFGGMVVIGIAIAYAREETITVGQIPAKVMAAVKAKFPNAKVTAASKEEEEAAAEAGVNKHDEKAKEQALYEIEIEDQGVKISVSATEDGKIVEIEKEVGEKDLPKSVRDSLSAKYPNAQLKKVEEVIEDGKTKFEVVVVTAVELVFDGDGTVTKEEVKSAADND